MGIQGNARGARRIVAGAAGGFDLERCKFEELEKKYVSGKKRGEAVFSAASAAFFRSNFWTKQPDAVRIQQIFYAVVVRPQGRHLLLLGVVPHGSCCRFFPDKLLFRKRE
jgi:hypothetical protein